MMDIKFVFKNEITEAQQIMINVVNKTCFGFDDTEIDQEEGNMFAVEFGAYLLLDNTKIVGVSYLYKKLRKILKKVNKIMQFYIRLCATSYSICEIFDLIFAMIHSNIAIISFKYRNNIIQFCAISTFNFQ